MIKRFTVMVKEAVRHHLSAILLLTDQLQQYVAMLLIVIIWTQFVGIITTKTDIVTDKVLVKLQHVPYIQTDLVQLNAEQKTVII
jgi:hypothetical protein